MNHYVVSCKKDVRAEDLPAMFEELARGPLQGKYVVTERKGDRTEWVLHHRERDFLGCTAWAESKRRVVFRKASGNEFAGWVQGLMMRAVAEAFAGRCAGTGGEGSWAAAEEPRTLRDYYVRKYGLAGSDFFKSETGEMPKDLQELALAEVSRIET